MTAALLLGVSMPSSPAAAKKKAPKLSTKKVSISVGQKKTIKLKNGKKAVWSIKSGKKVVSLSKKKKTSVVVKGKKAGKAVVLAKVRKNGEMDYLKTDGKAQVTIEYVDDFPIRIDSILISTQHSENTDIPTMQKDLIDKVILQVVDHDMIDPETKFFINPTGRFVIGGAIGDTGLTGRKIMCDTYGGLARNGGGAFSGKDPSKVDRSASYMARHIAKNVVANGMARKCEIQLSYGIGMKQPISLYIECFGTNRMPEHIIIKAIKDRFDLTPEGIIEYLNLKEPIYSKTTNYGHFGRKGFSWEQIVQI